MTRSPEDGVTAPVDEREHVARVVMTHKAGTLDRLRPLVTDAVILDQVRFSVADWQSGPETIIDRIGAAFRDRRVIVRSSAASEDQCTGSQAGRFESVLGVRARDPLHVRRAVDAVAASLRMATAWTPDRDLVFVQAQVEDIRASGVLFTRDLESRAPYFVISIDTEAHRTDAVTSGRVGRLTKIVVHRGADRSALSPDVRRLVEAADEIEALTSNDALDIEFAFDRSGTLFVFQVRPLVAPADDRHGRATDDELAEELRRIRDRVRQLMRPHRHLDGPDTLLGVMPDWNPAEMLGVAPRPLALSLYQTLIGDAIWAEARHEMGYRDVRPEPIVVSLGGRPYVDVRASLNSFLPKSLERAVTRRLVDRQLVQLRNQPELHDKIEFHVATTCLGFDFDENIPTFAAMGLEPHEIDRLRSALLTLTDAMLLGTVAPLEDQLGRIAELDRRRRVIVDRLRLDPESHARVLQDLIADGKRFGTLPFANLARYAFVSVALLRSLVRIGVVAPDELEALYRGIPTVASDLARDCVRHARRRLSTGELLARYGHLRPSTYEITSRNYATAPERYFASPVVPTGGEGVPDAKPALALFEAKRGSIAAVMRRYGFRAGPEQLGDFVLRSIAGREQAKFEFTKNVSLVLELIAQLGERLDLAREDMSFLPLDHVLRHAAAGASMAARLECRRDVERFRRRWRLTRALQLPPLIRSIDEIDRFEMRESLPNFITSKSVVAPVFPLDATSSVRDLDGRIVLIEGADPGYDWIFAHAIAGLVTQYGGIASHMSIRAAERGLPAAIGCGEIIFSRVRRSQLIELDCAAQEIRCIR